MATPAHVPFPGAPGPQPVAPRPPAGQERKTTESASASAAARWPAAVMVVAGSLSLALGILVVIGWHTGHILSPVARLFESVPVRYNVGVCFALSGICLVLLARNSIGAARIFAAPVALIALLTGCEYLFSVDLAIDQLALRGSQLATAISPRMAPNTVLSFTVLASALLLAAKRPSRLLNTLQAFLAALVVDVGLVGFIGYLADIPTAYSWGKFTPMAAPTALALVALAFGVIAFAWGQHTAQSGALPPWSPALGGLTLAAGSIALWQALHVLHPQSGLDSLALSVGLIQAALLYLVLHLLRGSRERGQQLHQLNSVLQIQIRSVGRAQQELRGAQAYTRSLIEASLDPLVTIAPDGKITDVNAATEAATGSSRQELIGTDFCDYFTAPAKARAGYQRVFREGSVHNYELELRHRSGGLTPVFYNASVYRDQEGAVMGVFAAARDIGELQRGEVALHQLASIVEFSDDAIISKSLDGTIVTWNKAAELLYGYTAAEAIGQNMRIIVPPELHEELTLLLQRVGRGEYIKHHDTVRMRQDGSRVDVSVSLSPVKDRAGNIDGVSTIVRDITERKRLEEALLARQAYTRSLIEASLDPLVTIAADGKITDVNAATEAVTGVGRGELIGSDFSNYFTEPDRARAGYQQVFAEGSVQDYPLAIHHRSGRITDVLYNASLFRNQAGEVEGVFAAARDITERKQLEDELRAKQAYSRSLIEASLDPLVTIAADGKITDVNAATEAVTGVGRGELIGSDFCNYFTEPDKARDGYQQVFAEGLVEDYPLAIRHRTGRVTEVLYNASIFRNEAGEVEGVFAAARDITERKKLEQELQARQVYTRSLIEASLDPLVTIAADGKITDVNVATEGVTGVGRGELIGSDFCNYFTEPDKARDGYQQVFAEGLVENYPLAIRHHSGRITEVLYNASVFRNQAGEVEGVFAAARDITERKRLEDSLRQRTLELENSVAELEAFSYSVSHDLRAPLRSIDGFSQILLEDYRDKVDAEGQDSLRRIRNASQNMGQLIDALLQLSRVMRAELRREPVDLSVLALSTAAMIQKAEPSRRVSFHVASGLQTRGDRRLLGVALQNLLQNAWKFTARTSEPLIEFGSAQQDGKTAYYVRDNGVGFDMTYANKLFTPFQRLHAQEQFEGTGIGLATVQRIIKRHGGRVWAEGEVGKGATFYFSLD